MTAKILERLALVFLVVTPVLWIAAFIFSLTPLGELLALVLYPLYAASITAMGVFLFGLLRRSRRGSVVLVALCYETLFFALTLWAVSIIVVARALGYELPFSGAVPRSFVVASMGASVVAVVAVYAARREGLLDMRVNPWIIRGRGGSLEEDTNTRIREMQERGQHDQPEERTDRAEGHEHRQDIDARLLADTLKRSQERQDDREERAEERRDEREERAEERRDES